MVLNGGNSVRVVLEEGCGSSASFSTAESWLHALACLHEGRSPGGGGDNRDRSPCVHAFVLLSTVMGVFMSSGAEHRAALLDEVAAQRKDM